MTVDVAAVAVGVVGTLLTVGFNLFMVARWTGRVEKDIAREQQRVDQLFARDERIFAELKEIGVDLKAITHWIAHEKGRQEAQEEHR